ncbi:hypothetical protein ACSESF_05225 [Pseudomonas aeruginosa]
MSKELNKAPVEQAGANVGHGHVLPRADGVKMRCGGPGLCSECTADASRARAALAQPSPAQTQPSPAPTLRAAIDVANDRFEVPVAKWGTDLVGEEERPEVAEVAFVLRNIGAMDAEDIDGDNVDLRFEDAEGRDTGCDVSIVEYAEKAADLFEQHDRIVGELRADRDSWAEQAEQRLADWDEMRKERDAALARVAELEKQEPVAWVEVIDRDYGPYNFHGKRLLPKGKHQLYAAPVAQAQHSVPELDQLYSMLGAESQVDAAKKIAELIGCRMSRSALTEAQMRRIYENSTEIENERLGFAAFARLMRRAEAVHQIAAAPGKEGV